jgi:hypothetical protein
VQPKRRDDAAARIESSSAQGSTRDLFSSAYKATKTRIQPKSFFFLPAPSAVGLKINLLYYFFVFLLVINYLIFKLAEDK